MANQQGTEKSREGSPVELNSQSKTVQPVMAEEWCFRNLLLVSGPQLPLGKALALRFRAN